MLSDEIRLRIGELQRSRPAESRTEEAPRAQVALPFSAPTSFHAGHASILERGQECENSSGKHLRFRRPLGMALGSLVDRAAVPDRNSGAANMHAELAAVWRSFPSGTLFLDLETCGFAGSPLFLIGLVWQEETALVIDQLFARHYAEERAVLETLWQAAVRHQVLVTFNGKSFDWPMVHDRSTRHLLGRRVGGGESSEALARCQQLALGRRDARPELVHCDLLHHARRRWKRVLPDCKLQTLERAICHRSRRDDLSGAQVPAAYHEFVRSGDARPLAGILDHNALDLLTLVQLTVKLTEPCSDSHAA